MSILVLCKFTPLGFETLADVRSIDKKLRCKFTPLGFETDVKKIAFLASCGVNLPRWGLKLCKNKRLYYRKSLCKFTPLGFETSKF